MADAMERAEIRNECLPIEPGDVLRFRGEQATYESRYYYNGLRREAVYVFQSDTYEIHVSGDSVKAVLPDGDDVICKIEGKDERDAVIMSGK